MQSGVALRTIAFEVGSERQGRRATEAARSRDRLDQSGESRTSYIDRWPWPLRLWAIFPRTIFAGVSIAVRVTVTISILISALAVFTITVHGCETRSLEEMWPFRPGARALSWLHNLMRIRRRVVD